MSTFIFNFFLVWILLFFQSQLILTQQIPMFIEFVNVSVFDFNLNTFNISFNNSTENSELLNGAGIIISNSPSLNTSCTFRNLTFQSIVSNEIQGSVMLEFDSYSSALLRLYIGNNPNDTCLRGMQSTFIYISPIFFFNQILVNATPLNPQIFISDKTLPQISSWNINLLNGSIDIEFTEPVQLGVNFYSLVGLHFSPEGLIQDFLPLDSLNININSTFRQNIMVSIGYNELSNINSNYCFNQMFCYITSITFAFTNYFRDVFDNQQNIFDSLQVSNFVHFNESYFSSLESNIKIVGVNQMLISWSAPLVADIDVIKYSVYLFPNKTKYFRGDCSYHPLYTILVNEAVIYSNLDIVLTSIPNCVNASNYRCTVTTNTSSQLNSFAGYDHIVLLVTTYTNRPESTEQINFTAAQEYEQLLQFSILESSQPSDRFKRGESPTVYNNQHNITWSLYALFCVNHRLSFYYGFLNQLGGTYLDMDTNTTCFVGNTALFSPDSSYFVNVEILIGTSEIQSFLTVGTCQFVTIQIFSNPFSDINVANRPLLSYFYYLQENSVVNAKGFERRGFSEVQNNRETLNIDFLNTPNITIEYSNIYLIPTYSLEFVPPPGYNCTSGLTNYTVNNYFRIKPTIYYPYAFNDLSSQNKFNLTCPPPNGELYKCFSIIKKGNAYLDIPIELFQEYATTIIIENVFLIDTNFPASLGYIRSLPFNFSHYNFDFFPSSTFDTGFRYVLPFPYRCVQDSVVLTRVHTIYGSNSTMTTNPCSSTQIMYHDGLAPTTDYGVAFYQFSEDANTCISGIEANGRLFTFSTYTGRTRIFDYDSIDHNTLAFHYQLNRSLPLANVQGIIAISVPTSIPNFSSGISGNLCPSLSTASSITTNDITLLTSSISTSNSTIFNQFVGCEPNNEYFCVKLDNPLSSGSVTMPIHSFVFNYIYFNVISMNGSVIESSMFPINPLMSSFLSSEISGNTTATTASIYWDPNYFCPSQSLILIKLNFFPQRKRGLSFLTIQGTTLCSEGQFMFINLFPNTGYNVNAYFLYNNTAIEVNGFVGTCPYLMRSIYILTNLPIPDPFLLTFSNVKIVWESFAANTNLIAGVFPLKYAYVSQPLCNADSYLAIMTMLLNDNIEYEPAPPCIVEGCITSNVSSNEVILDIPPGFDYKAFLLTPSYGALISYTSTNTLIEQSVNIISGQISVFFTWDSALCTDNTSVYIPTSDNISHIYSCAIGSIEIVNTILDQSEISLNFIFPLNDTYISDQNLQINNTNSCGIILQHSLSTIDLIPIGVAPRIDSVLPSYQNLTYIVYLHPLPPISSFTQLFLYYIVSAFPFSPMFRFSNSSCPSIVNSSRLEFFRQPFYDSLLDISPLAIDRCENRLSGELICATTESLTTQIVLLQFLGYYLFVDAKLSSGLVLRNYFQLFEIEPTQSDLSSYFEFTDASNTTSIVLYWNNQINTCSNMSLAFSISRNGNSLTDQYISTTPCSQGNFRFQNLTPNTVYQIYYGVYYSIPLSSCFISENINNMTSETISVCSLSPCGQGTCQDTTNEEEEYYICNCSLGYNFINGTCMDINECANPNFCQNATCSNLISPYTCECFLGYEKMNETRCIDLNECLNETSCINGNCTNELPPGFYTCDCFTGYGGINCGTLLTTTQLNTTFSEISESPTMQFISSTIIIPTIAVGVTCPNDTTINNLGNVLTWPTTENGSIGTKLCSDFNIDLIGNVTRTCRVDGVWEMPNFDACFRQEFFLIEAQVSSIKIYMPEEIITIVTQVFTATNSNDILFPGDIMVTTNAVTGVIANLQLQDSAQLTGILQQVQQEIVSIVSNTLSVSNIDSLDSLSNSTQVITELIDNIQSLGNLITQTLEPTNQTVIVEDINTAIIAQVVENVVDNLIYGSSNSTSNSSALFLTNSQVTIPASALTSSTALTEISLSFFPTVYQLGAQIPTSSSGLTGNDITVGTGVVSINIAERNGSDITNFSDNSIVILFGFQNTTYSTLAQNNSLSLVFLCQSLQNGDRTVGWSPIGVVLANPDEVPFQSAMCEVSHLTSFAVLVSVTSITLTPGERIALDVLTYITCGISIIFLILSLVLYAIVFIRTRKMKDKLFNKDATYLHVNFGFSLLVALVFFLISSTAYGNRIACNILTLISYYLWLTVFFSSLSIGLYIFVKIFTWSRDVKYWYYLVISAWALPILFIIIVAPSRWNNLIDRNGMNCWLNPSSPYHVNLAFIIPMIIIVIFNLIFLISTMVILYRISNQKNELGKLKNVAIATIIFMPVLGIPWLFGLVSSIPTSAFAFIFTVILGLQGFFFALIYPLRTQEVIDFVWKWRSPTKEALKKQTASTHSSSGATTGSQRYQSVASKFKINAKKSEGEKSIHSEIDLVDIEIKKIDYSTDALDPRNAKVDEIPINSPYPIYSEITDNLEDHYANNSEKPDSLYNPPPAYDYEISDFNQPENNLPEEKSELLMETNSQDQ